MPFSIASALDRRRLGLAVLVAAACLLQATAIEADSADKIRGITISTHRGGQEWATDVIVPTFEQVRALGANWVTIHPYAGIHADGTVAMRTTSDDPQEHISRPIREAHALGLKILIKPHLAYWGSPFSWRGEIAFDTQDEWQRFFRSYGEWIVDMARASAGADAFAVGTELDNTLEHQPQWRGLIERVREVFPGPLTYAANWNEYRRVPFWDALDSIGVQAYFPLTDRELPEEADLRAGWQDIMRELNDFATQHDRYVVFTELGYNRSLNAARRPWESHTDGEEASVIQEMCLRIALEAINNEERVVGAFLWKWFPEPRPLGRSFQLAAPGMQRVIRGAWQ